MDHEECTCITVLSTDKKICSKVQHTLLDEMSTQKGSTKDKDFSSPGYLTLISRFVTLSEQQNMSQKGAVAEVKRKLIKKRDSGD